MASPLTSPWVVAKRLLDLAQGAEVAGAECLGARTVVTIERRDVGRAARGLGFLRGAEPQPNMVGVNRGKGRVRLGVVHLRRSHPARSNREQLFAEDASGGYLTVAVVVCIEVCLVSGDAKGAVRLLGQQNRPTLSGFVF